jgi:hypothetical protein
MALSSPRSDLAAEGRRYSREPYSSRVTATPFCPGSETAVRAPAGVTLAESRAVVGIADAAPCIQQPLKGVGSSFELANAGVAAMVAAGGGQASRRV